MATTVSTLKMKFGTMAGNKTFSVRYSKNNPTAQQVKTVMETMITNGSIYKYPPLTIDSATVETKTTSSLDVS